MAKNSDVWFDPKDLLWRTRGYSWGYAFVSLPIEPQITSWSPVYDQVFGRREPEEKPTFIYGKLVYGRFSPVSVKSRPFVAVSYRDPSLQDEKGRAIAHELLWLIDSGISLETVKAILPEDWYEQILTALRPFLETDEVFKFSKEPVNQQKSQYPRLENYFRNQLQKVSSIRLKPSTRASQGRWDRIPDVRIPPVLPWRGVILGSLSIGLLLWIILFPPGEPPEGTLQKVSIAIVRDVDPKEKTELAVIGKEIIEKTNNYLGTITDLSVTSLGSMEEGKQHKVKYLMKVIVSQGRGLVQLFEISPNESERSLLEESFSLQDKPDRQEDIAKKIVTTIEQGTLGKSARHNPQTVAPLLK